MAPQAVTAFFHHLKHNEPLQRRVEAIEARDPARIRAELVAIGALSGFQFSIQELRAVEGKLDDEARALLARVGRARHQLPARAAAD